VPALVAGAVARTGLRRPVYWPGVLAVSASATLAVLGMRALYAENNVSVLVAPFAALSFYMSIGTGLVWPLLGAVAFPLTVVVCWPRVLRERPDLALAWGASAIGFAEGYLLAEGPPRTDHANLLVAASQGVFVLMVASGAALLSRMREAPSDWRYRVAWGVFALHLLGGIRHVGWKLEARHWAQPFTVAVFIALVVWWWTTMRPHSGQRTAERVEA
jgi:hypothetical protein